MGEDEQFFALPEKSSVHQKEIRDVSSSTASVGSMKHKVSVAVGHPSNSNTSTAPLMSSIDPQPRPAFSVEEANEEIAILLTSGKVSQVEVSALQGMMRDHVALREKVNKLKSLLGRSAKAQRESKLELENTTKRLEQALRDVERLNHKVEHLANRPTHMDLLADFETNFDRALLSAVGTHHDQQSGGEHSAPTVSNSPSTNAQQHLQQHPQHHQYNHHPSSQNASSSDHQIVDSMLLQELAEGQARIERLENLNTALLHRTSQLENQTKQLLEEKDSTTQQLERVQLELKMAKMQAEHATRAVQDKMQSLQEMQLEIDLVTKASMDANVRAKQGEEAAKSVQTDRETVQQLQAQVTALSEWALANAEAKRLCQERVRLLEQRCAALEAQQNDSGDAALAGVGGAGSTGRGTGGERTLLTKTLSMVVGAGDVGTHVVSLAAAEDAHLQPGERFVLRWKFDLTPADLNCEFSILKGICDTAKRLRADYLIRNRLVTGGAGGEVEEGAFCVQNACTLLWSNEKSWVRPRTIKYTYHVLAVKD